MPALRRLLPFLLLPVGVAGVIAVRSWPVDVEAERAGPADVVAEVLGVGVLESAREVRVAFEASGRVLALDVDEGETVEEGAVLGTIDVSDAGRELAVAVATEQAAAAAVSRANAELDRGRATRALAGVDLGRAHTLLAGGVIAPADHDAAIERDAGAAASTRALEAALSQAERSYAVATRTRAVRAAQVEDGLLRSPLTGLVTARTAEAGQLVSPGTPAFTIVATDTMRVSAWVDETALGRLAVGQPARVLFRSEEGRVYPGEVERIGREVDRQTHELLVDVAVRELPTNFAVGQRADVWIEVGRRAAALSVPRGWCAPQCAVVEDDRVVLRDVQLGLTGRERVEVLSGLAAEDLVLAPGAPVGARVRAQVRP